MTEDQTVTTACVTALFNYTASIYTLLEHKQSMSIPLEPSDHVREYVSFKVGTKLVEFWEGEVVEQCGVNFDTDLVNDLIDEEKMDLVPHLHNLREYLKETHADFEKEEEEMNAREKAREKEMERILYG